MADEYIRKEDAEDVIAKRSGFETAGRAKKWAMMHPIDLDSWFGAAATAIIAVESLEPVDVVPVVRCRKCKHCIASRQGKVFCIRGFEQTIISAFAAIDNPIFERELDSFCSYGERKE